MNGATQTFRRPSGATNPSHTRENSHPASVLASTSSGAYISPHMSSNTTSNPLRNGEARYSKEQLLDLYKAQREAGILGKNVENYFVADWDPHMVTPPVNGAWGKRDDHKASAGPEVCWDHDGQSEPLGLTDMSENEKEVGTICDFCCLVFVCSNILAVVLLRFGQFASETTANQHLQRKYRPWNWRSQIVRLLLSRPQLQCLLPQCQPPRCSPPRDWRVRGQPHLSDCIQFPFLP